MPLISITLGKGKSAEYRRAITDGVHAALVACFNIPDSDRLQRVLELEPENFEWLGYMSPAAVVIEIQAFAGRTLEAKSSLYRKIVEDLGQKPGIKPMDIFIVVQDIPRENWGIRGGQMASQVLPEPPTP